jgi:hypothetical protein
MYHPFATLYRLRGASPETDTTTLTLIRKDIVGKEGLTHQSGTTSILDMYLILIAKVAQGGEHRIGGGSS